MCAKAETTVFSEGSNMYTPAASTVSVATAPEDLTSPPSSSIPWPGSTYIIQHVATSRAVTFSLGSIVLRPPTTSASIRWSCVSKAGWLGFQDLASAMYLGHNRSQNYEMACFVRQQNTLEDFCIRQKREGEYVLLQKWGKGELKPVGVNKEGKLAVINDVNDKSTSWRFIKVETEGAES